MNEASSPDLSFLKAPKPKGPTCPSCRFMARDGKQMTCRRQPPTACVVLIPIEQTRMGARGLERGMGMQPQTVTAWPLVMDDWWCGEWSGAFIGAQPTIDPGFNDMTTEIARVGGTEPHPSLVPRMEGDDRDE